MIARMRPARAEDGAALADLTTELGYPTDAEAMLSRVGALLGQAGVVVLVAVDPTDRPIAWIHVGVSHTLQQDAHAVIHGLVVSEAHRSAGIGADLLAAGEDWARRRGLLTVLVRSRSTRRGAHRFYLDRGYAEIKRSHVFEKRLV